MIRIIATLLWNGQTLVKGVGFDAWRPVGHPLQAINVFQLREVDEIIFLDITATRERRRPNFQLVESLSRECFVPLTIGGGIRSIEDVHDLLRAGADKVCIHTATDLLPSVADKFGRQVTVVCHDYDETIPAPICHTADHRTLDPQHFGELLVQSITRDGTMAGYDIDGLRRMTENAPLPMIAAGGAGKYEHFAQAIDAGAAAVAAGAMWLFTEQTPLEAKRYLAARSYPVRL